MSARDARRSSRGAILATLRSHIADFAGEYGAVGVALGGKEVAGKTVPGSPTSVCFIVDRKLPRKGSRRRLSDGRRLIPKRCVLGDVSFPTDVVVSKETGTDGGDPASARFSAGGALANASDLGTIGCLVEIPGEGGTFILTNRHVAISAGIKLFVPSRSAPSRIEVATHAVEDLVPDERLYPFLDAPATFFDIDAALVAIPPPAAHLFSPAIPTIGVPTLITATPTTSVLDYERSLRGRAVESWSWRSQRRHGRISHVFFMAPRTLGRPAVVYGFLIEGIGAIPSQPMDSGKIWVERLPDGTVSILGLHQGSVPGPGGNRFAVASDVSAIARVMPIQPRRS